MTFLRVEIILGCVRLCATRFQFGWLIFVCVLGVSLAQGLTFRVATFNVENYVDFSNTARREKSAESKAKIRESIRAMQPDVIALMEMGETNLLLELRESLRTEGLSFPHWEHVAASDTNIHLAILSRFSFTARQPHTNENFLINGRRFRVSRGFAEVNLQVSPTCSFTLIAAHLKSRRGVPQADESEFRFEEARLLRELIDTHLTTNPHANLVVLGDFNDTPDSPVVKTIIGRGKQKLVDIRPGERSDSEVTGTTAEVRRITWTHFYAKDDTYSRVDYLLLSPGMARLWLANRSYVLNLSGWGVASDHRPLVAEFQVSD